jgi:hypothetical protein
LVIHASSVPVILVLVWFFDVRPFTSFFGFLDNLLSTDLAAKVNDKGIPPAIYGAIDVALLTFIYNFIKIILSKIAMKPVKISFDIKDRKTNQNLTAIPFDKENVGTQSPTQVKINGEIEIRYAKWFVNYILRGIRISIQWHPKWLSVVPQLDEAMINLDKLPGEINFNLMDALSEEENSTTIEGRISILANSDFKRDGFVSIIVGINSKNKIIRLCFHWLIMFLVKTDLKPLKVILEKGS